MPVIVPTNGGTVDFVARKARLRGDAETILAQLVDALDRGHAPATIEVDTCLHRGEEVDDDGALKPFERLGLASAVGGVARNFFDHFYQLPKTRGAGAIAGVIGAAAGGAILQSLAPGVQRLFSDRARAFAEEFYKPTRARVEVDGKELASDCFMSLQVGAIDINLAGVVRCFRRAASGGVLHFQAIATTPFGVLVNVPSIVLGTPIVGRDVFDGEAKTVTITPADGGAVDPVIDGEPFTGLRWLELSLGPRLRIPLLRH